MNKKTNKGITLIALVITAIILLILAGVTLNLVTGGDGILNKTTTAVEKNNNSQMKEELELALSDLQAEKLGKATVEDITKEWLQSKFPQYQVSVIDENSTNAKKIKISQKGTIATYSINESLKVTEVETADLLTYSIKSKDGDNIEILITIVSSDVGLSKITLPDGQVIECNGEKEKEILCTVEYGQENVITITTEDGQQKEEKILIDEYYYNVTKELSEGVKIDNDAAEVKYNTSYMATISIDEGYKLKTLTVTMGGESVTIDETTGVINIEKVTGDIKIVAVAEMNNIPFEEYMAEYWPLTEDLSNKVTTSTTGDLVLYNGKLPKSFSEENGAEFDTTVLKTTSNYTFPSQFCIILKIKPIEENPSKEFRFIWSKSSGIYGSHNAFNSIEPATGSQKLYMRNGIFTDSPQEETTGELKIGTWSTIIYQFDGTNLNGYVNGTCITEGNYAKKGFSNVTSPLYIGGTYFTGGTHGGLYWGYMNGYFKNVAIFNKAFTPSEIEEINAMW